MHRLSGNVRVQGPLKLNYFREPSFFDLFLVFFFQQGERTYLFVHILLHILGSRRFGDHQNKIILENLPFSIFFQYFSFNRVKEPISLFFCCCIFWGLGDVRTLLGTTKIKMTENHDISLFLTLCKKNREKEQQSLRKLLKPFMSPNLYFLHTIWYICFCSKYFLENSLQNKHIFKVPGKA